MWISRDKYNKLKMVRSTLDVTKQENRSLRDKLIKLRKQNADDVLDFKQLECEKCGCLVGDNHKAGEPVVVPEQPALYHWMRCGIVHCTMDIPEHIHKPIYCLRCAPKKKKDK